MTSTPLANLSVVQMLVLALPVLIPFVVDLITKSAAPDWLKSTLALLLSCATGAVSAAVVSDGEHWQQYLAGIAYSTVVAFVTHLTGASTKVQKATANFGLDAGTPSTSEPPPVRVPDVVVPTPTAPQLDPQAVAAPAKAVELPAPVVKGTPQVSITSTSVADAGGVITLAISLDPTDYSRYLLQMLNVAANKVSAGT